VSLYEQLRVLCDVALAMALGGLIGLERMTAAKPAGLRTQMLLAGASALVVGIGVALLREFQAALPPDSIRSDPIRVLGAVFTGVSFLGAGSIIHGRGAGSVAGLTTAASLLFTGSLGITVGLRLYPLAIGVTLLALLALRILNRFEPRDPRPDSSTVAPPDLAP
jgi:putative Mg2+ transporter-C (MgtC) family protein